jgi:RND family efflux transporter MFP subunit
MHRGVSRNSLRLVFGFSIALAGVLLWGIRPAPSQEQGTAAPVKVAEVVTMDIAPQVVLIGTALPKVTSVVASEIEGLVERFGVNEGDHVERGAVLARLEDSLLQIRLTGARASKAEAEAQLRRARADLRRSSELLASKTIADKKYTDDLAQVESLAARVRRLEAEIEHHQDSIAKKTIEAPFTGFVVKEHTQVGEWVDKGGPIVTMADLSKVEVVVDAPERYIPRLQLGDPVRVKVDALNPEEFNGKIAALIPVGDAAGRTFPVKVSVDNEALRIKGGMLCRAALGIGKPRSVTAVPKDAVVNVGQRHLLYVVREGVAQSVPVRLGDASDSMIEIRGPLEPGARVVIRGNERLQPGQPVEIID